ncbi:PREDICTED: CBS domain-containing protein CBSX5-like [Ipomoea nil]|uniref:CBS domain-containing protein CBSX5-like n=1 Tax=Ipomoea nil TaxID=35883 RepID=UPI000900A1CA|nr:PREDICTED: CBS domain-containing protein CBSX5-like [Ipomoea nil]
MATGLLGHKVADLCLGKPALRSLSVASGSVGDALAALNSGEDAAISVWSCDHSPGGENIGAGGCVCIGKICMVDIISYLCKVQEEEENLSSPSNSLGLALAAPLSVLLSQIPGPIPIRHVQPSSSIVEAIDLMAQGVQNLVVPIERVRSSSRRKFVLQKKTPSTITTIHNAQEFCWLTQEDVMRYLLGSIGLFSPLPALSIHALGVIAADFPAVGYHSPASSALKAIHRSLADQTSVAVVDDDGVLIREISPSALAACDETLAAAVAALSAGELMAYIDGNSSSSQSLRMSRRAGAIVCHPGSSLAAVMIQAIANRVNYVWVIEDDWSLVGIVTFSNILRVFRQYLEESQTSTSSL